MFCAGASICISVVIRCQEIDQEKAFNWGNLVIFVDLSYLSVCNFVHKCYPLSSGSTG